MHYWKPTNGWLFHLVRRKGKLFKNLTGNVFQSLEENETYTILFLSKLLWKYIWKLHRRPHVNVLHLGFRITSPPTYFQSFSAVIGLLPASDAFIFLNKLAAGFYPAPISRIRTYFEIFPISRHIRLLSAGSSQFEHPPPSHMCL